MDGPALLALQQVDVELDELAGRRRRLPEHAALEAARATHRALVAERAAQQAVLAEAEAAIADAEQRGAALDVKQRRLEGQLKTVIAPREAEALMHEIDTIRSQHGELDDLELAAMERQSDAESELQRIASREPTMLEAVRVAEEDLQRVLDELASEESALRQRREAASAAVSEGDARTYDQLRTRFGGVGIVQLVARRCSGCHLDLSATEADVVKSAPVGELPECPHCGRLIVR